MEPPERRESDLLSRLGKRAVVLTDRATSSPSLTSGGTFATLAPISYASGTTPLTYLAAGGAFSPSLAALTYMTIGGAASTSAAYLAAGGAFSPSLAALTYMTIGGAASTSAAYLAAGGTGFSFAALAPVTSAVASAINLNPADWFKSADSSQDKQVKLVQDVASVVRDLQATARQLAVELTEMGEARRSLPAGDAASSAGELRPNERTSLTEQHYRQITVLIAVLTLLVCLLQWLFPQTPSVTPTPIEHKVKSEIHTGSVSRP